MITLEFLLVMAVFVIPIGLGLIMLGRKVITAELNRQQTESGFYSRPVVFDAAGRAVGPVVGYDPFEAPLVIFRDETTKGGVALGVRPTRLTSYGRVYWTNADCTGTPYVRAPRAATSETSDGSLLNPPVGFLYQLAGQSYAMGSATALYRSHVPEAAAGGASIGSVWISQLLPLPPDTACSPIAGAPSDLVEAELAAEFDGSLAAGNYALPFQVAFPSAADAPVMPPDDGG